MRVSFLILCNFTSYRSQRVFCLRDNPTSVLHLTRASNIVQFDLIINVPKGSSWGIFNNGVHFWLVSLSFAFFHVPTMTRVTPPPRPPPQKKRGSS